MREIGYELSHQMALGNFLPGKKDGNFKGLANPAFRAKVLFKTFRPQVIDFYRKMKAKHEALFFAFPLVSYGVLHINFPSTAVSPDKARGLHANFFEAAMKHCQRQVTPHVEMIKTWLFRPSESEHQFTNDLAVSIHERKVHPLHPSYRQWLQDGASEATSEDLPTDLTSAHPHTGPTAKRTREATEWEEQDEWIGWQDTTEPSTTGEGLDYDSQRWTGSSSSTAAWRWT